MRIIVAPIASASASLLPETSSVATTTSAGLLSADFASGALATGVLAPLNSD